MGFLSWLAKGLLLSYAGMSLACLPARASEIDNISHYYDPLPDSGAVLDRKVQEAIDGAISRAKSCDLSAFGAMVAGKLVSRRFYTGAMEEFALYDPHVVRASGKMGASIYAHTPLAFSVVGVTYGLDPIVAVKGVKIGTDKLGHFMDHGHHLFQIHEGGGSMSSVVDASVGEEEGAWGLFTTGVKSYGDLAANMDGLSFWMDVYGRGRKPYAACVGGRLVKARDFHFEDFVTPAWDEAINCNQYSATHISLPSLDSVQLALEGLGSDPEACDSFYESQVAKTNGIFAFTVDQNVRSLERRTGLRFRCPIDPALCRSAGQAYQSRFGANVAKRILYPECRP